MPRQFLVGGSLLDLDLVTNESIIVRILPSLLWIVQKIVCLVFRGCCPREVEDLADSVALFYGANSIAR